MWENTLGIVHSYVSYWKIGMGAYSPETELTLNDHTAGYFGRWKWVSPSAYLPENGWYWIKLAAEDSDGNRGEAAFSIWVGTTDTDADGVADAADNCPDMCNTGQQDADADGIGDVCDPTPGCGGCGQPECGQEC
jgi:hypothetical protein